MLFRSYISGMTVKIRDKHQQLQNLIIELDQKDKPIWKAVAADLNRPRRAGFKMNLFRLEKISEGKETVVVPGIVLGTGEISKKLNIAALQFSGSAKGKIEKAGGKCWSIHDLVKENPEGKGVRILG